ncbi:TIGR03943 family protein [Kibdelosporangium philippinense]|uniref:TIGR03943 family protein n=1 Tax=Kibdelosporangium philippinense TaxID=211113 RepID=A0ABS8ZYB2_9PSEU|nr:TIGR03943 family protein [Kibdelosporangium philippinense]MCE7011643.1 TIGR03943 family protein [Kibdelosporangium philippinense]
MKRETQNILLVLLGGALLKIALNGTYLRYVKPGQQAWLIAAGGVMVILAFVSITRDIIAARRPEQVVAEVPDHGHSHGGFQSHSTWLLILPVLAVFLAPPALGEDAVNRAAGRTPPPPSSSDEFSFPALPAGDPIDQRVMDFVERAAWDKSGSLNDRNVRLTGFIVHNENSTYLARLAIGCCAADAYPVKVKLDNPEAKGFVSDTWVQAVVRYQPGSSTKESRHVPTVTLTDIQSIPEPPDPYEY